MSPTLLQEKAILLQHCCVLTIYLVVSLPRPCRSTASESNIVKISVLFRSSLSFAAFAPRSCACLLNDTVVEVLFIQHVVEIKPTADNTCTHFLRKSQATACRSPTYSTSVGMLWRFTERCVQVTTVVYLLLTFFFMQLKLISRVNQAQPTIQLLLSTSDFIGALDLIHKTKQVVVTQLQGVRCVK